ncbi:MAG: pyridoxamine kinase [Oscillospiraceae bacterium]|nr:pyridoxamine kinase [Oscillospiraceae bacterium]
MIYKRILTIQDISCVGQCSMTVALPILSVCGHETCILPTALLSTHTGGFGKPEVVHFDGALEGMWRHWQENDITFDAILVGYLGSVGAVEAAGDIIDQLLAPGGISIVDPAMADHGKRYSGLSEAYAGAMEALCRSADIILPNITEAAMMAGLPYREELDEAYVSDLLAKLNHPKVVLTGVGYEPGHTGVAVKDGETIRHYSHRKIGKSYHGTGDMFAACFTGALMQEKSMTDAVKIAADFTCRAIANTAENPAHWYGVKFETALPELIRMLGL